MFRRNTSFDTAYVGSSNLSRAALLDGVEWNVRLSRVGTPTLLEKFRATFDTYWNDSSLRVATTQIAIETGSTMRWPRHPGGQRTTGSPSPSQGWRCGRSRTSRRCSKPSRPSAQSTTAIGISSSQPQAPARPSLPRSTTENLCADRDERPSLLFIAHRREILEQSLRTYREVLADAYVRRVVRRRCAAGAVAPRLRKRSIAQLVRHHQHPGRRLRDRRDRRVPPRGGGDRTGESLTTSSRSNCLD